MSRLRPRPRPSTHRCLLGVTCLTFLGACVTSAPTSELGFTVGFACSEDREATELLSLAIRPGGCRGAKTLYEAELRRGDPVPAVSRLPPGRYGLEATARAAGAVVASACVERQLPADRKVELLLRSATCELRHPQQDAMVMGVAGSSDAAVKADTLCMATLTDCDGGCVVSLDARSCDDGKPCTDDVCTPAGCEHRNNDGNACTDGVACTTDTCTAGQCVSVANDAACPDDGNVCTDAVCELGVGCTDVHNQAACSDGEACTDGDHCAAGSCIGSSTSCPSGASCELKSCGGGCVDVSSSEEHCGRCGRPCRGGELCENGACKPSTATSCTGYRYGDHDYLVCTDARSWAAARSACRSWGRFDLVIATSAGENDEARTRSQAAAAGEFWIGANDRGNAYVCSCSGDEEAEWAWVQPSPEQEEGADLCQGNNPCAPAAANTYVNWGAGEPNNAGCSCPFCNCSAGQDCALLTPAGTWDDQDCGADRGYICESY